MAEQILDAPVDTLGVAAPKDIAKVGTFLSSDDSAHLTGATLSPTGGLTVD